MNKVFQANPGGHFNLTVLGQHTDSFSSDEADHRLASFSNNANTSDISSILEKIDEQSEQAICDAKFHIVTRVTARCKFNPNYFLHGEVVSIDDKTLIYTVHVDREDSADPQHYTEDELQKIIFKPVLGIGCIAFVPLPVCQSLNSEDRAKLIPRLYMYSKVM